MTDDGAIIRNDGPTMFYLIVKSINPDTSIGTSNIKDETKKSNIAKFRNKVKDVLYDMSSNYSIITDK